MNEDPFKKQEQLAVRIEIATPEDWEAYKEIRLLAITGKDANMFEVSQDPQKLESEIKRIDQEWKDLLDKNDSFVVLAWRDSQVIGMGVVSKKEKYWSLGGGYVREGFREENNGKKIFAKRLQVIRGMGGIKARTGMDKGNSRSIGIATFFGFKQTTEDLDEEDDFEMELKNVNDPEVIKKIKEVLGEK